MTLSACSGNSSGESMDGDISSINSYIQYSETFASSGQPSKQELQLVANDGVKRVIFLALTDSHMAIKHEDSLVKDLGMSYVHIPVDFQKPNLTDFQTFVALMQMQPDTKTLLHCQVNLRASTFSFLYRTLFLNVPIAQAKADMDSIWEPNEDWYKFIQTVAAHYELDLNCDECDWGANEFI